jgi:hypothetical protein
VLNRFSLLLASDVLFCSRLLRILSQTPDLKRAVSSTASIVQGIVKKRTPLARGADLFLSR